MGLLLAAVTVLYPDYWVGRLGAAELDTRDDAVFWLKTLGMASVPVLTNAARDGSLEAKHLLRVIPLQDQLSVQLRTAIRGVEERLATGDDRVWLQVFLAALQLERIPKSDFDLLLEPACRGAVAACDKIELIRYVQRSPNIRGARCLARYLADGDDEARKTAQVALRALSARHRVEAIVTFLELDRTPEDSLECGLAWIDPEDAARALAPEFAIRKPRAGARALLRRLDLRELFFSEDVRIRLAVCDMSDSAPDLCGRLWDPHPAVRARAIVTLSRRR